MRGTSPADLSPFYGRTVMVNVVVETPKGSSLKIKYDEQTRVFRAHKALPAGFTFPFSFGFIPRTIAGDGDPLDALILSDYEMPLGSIIVGQILSVLEAEQSENGKLKQRNDRLIVAPWDLVAQSPMVPEVSFDKTLKHAITDFFTKYNEAQGKQFRPLTFASPSSRHSAHAPGDPTGERHASQFNKQQHTRLQKPCLKLEKPLGWRSI